MADRARIDLVKFVVVFLKLDVLFTSVVRFVRYVANHPHRSALWFLMFLLAVLPSTAAVTNISSYLKLFFWGALLLFSQMLLMFGCCLILIFLLVSLSHPLIAARSVRRKIVQHWTQSVSRAVRPRPLT